MQRSQSAALGVSLAVLLGGVALAVLGPRLLHAAAGPDAEAIAYLKATEKPGLSLEIAGADAPLVSAQHRYDRFAASLDPSGEPLFLGATLDFKGRLGRIAVGGFTAERLVFVRDGADWVPRDNEAPLLVGVVTALEQRRRALEAFDRAALEQLRAKESGPAPVGDGRELDLMAALRNRTYAVSAWYIRAEGDEAVVTEDYRLTGDLPDQPLDRKASRRLTLRRDGREFFFWPGIM